jgi:hypothetical protein
MLRKIFDDKHLIPTKGECHADKNTTEDEHQLLFFAGRVAIS